MPPKSAVKAAQTITSVNIRQGALSKLTEVLSSRTDESNDFEIVVIALERGIFNESLKLLVQSPDAKWDSLYRGIFSNIHYSLSDYKHSKENIDGILELVGKSESIQKLQVCAQIVKKILNDGPLELNKSLKAYQRILHQEQIGKIALAPNDTTKCPNCGGRKTHRTLAQLKSGDEGETALFSCTVPTCGYEWRRG